MVLLAISCSFLHLIICQGREVSLIDLQIPQIPSLLNASKADSIVRCSVINLNVPDLHYHLRGLLWNFGTPWQWLTCAPKVGMYTLGFMESSNFDKQALGFWLIE